MIYSYRGMVPRAIRPARNDGIARFMLCQAAQQTDCTIRKCVRLNQELLIALGVTDFTRASTQLTAVLADATQALQLEINEGDLLLRATGIGVDPSEHPVEHGRSFFVRDRDTLTLTA